MGFEWVVLISGGMEVGEYTVGLGAEWDGSCR